MFLSIPLGHRAGDTPGRAQLRARHQPVRALPPGRVPRIWITARDQRVQEPVRKG